MDNYYYAPCLLNFTFDLTCQAGMITSQLKWDWWCCAGCDPMTADNHGFKKKIHDPNFIKKKRMFDGFKIDVGSKTKLNF